ncbi:hypothetical protein AB1Y20_003159 [Prymnesium parvum]|uniref:Uncharacterized protein n=1 Tax=Prymnesium parvum TaxID=97485 RepID=A0AB34JC85_PRYPA
MNGDREGSDDPRSRFQALVESSAEGNGIRSSYPSPTPQGELGESGHIWEASTEHHAENAGVAETSAPAQTMPRTERTQAAEREIAKMEKIAASHNYVCYEHQKLVKELGHAFSIRMKKRVGNDWDVYQMITIALPCIPRQFLEKMIPANGHRKIALQIVVEKDDG